jgi:hypothetical protein
LKSAQAFSYRLAEQVCDRDGGGELCYNPRPCISSNGTPGTWYWVEQAPYGTTNYTRTEWLYCNTAEEQEVEITAAMAFSAMKRLSWPAADLVIQPPGGRTLVNFPTNFFTHLAPAPRVQPVTIAERHVDIEATPTFVWHWAGTGETNDPADAVPFSTTDPGAAYVQGRALAVSHEYADAHVTVHPWVDVVYTGRFRVDGGDWQAIPDTLTVAGTPVALEVVEARLRLVG